MRSDRSGGAEVTAGDDARVTRVGRILRKAKIDEIPELWNILSGDMSFVGPRPEVPRYVDPADPRWAAVLRARPGLTDPVTLRLRNEEALLAGVPGDPETFYRTCLQPYKLRGYAAYLDSRSWRTDLRVLVETIRAVLRPGSAPPPALADVLAERLQTATDVP
jgi:lipopolysaccharide/colanic/teichoic acid biosynthesis glycosyltransferase